MEIRRQSRIREFASRIFLTYVFLFIYLFFYVGSQMILGANWERILKEKGLKGGGRRYRSRRRIGLINLSWRLERARHSRLAIMSVIKRMHVRISIETFHLPRGANFYIRIFVSSNRAVGDLPTSLCNDTRVINLYN